MYYSDDVINEVLSRNDIVDVIGSYASLKKKGANYEACCPFHHEKTPSFKVNREKQMYHCFGCGVGGNVFTFVMEYENLNFPEAVERLAERAGVQLPEKSMNAQERSREQYKITLREMNKTAAAYFHYILKHSQHGEKAYEYFHETRGLSDETINKFALGYSDIYRDDLYRYLKSKGYTDDQMKGSGLVEISEKEGGVDKFWNRAMIPILDINGKVIAFGGRVMGDGKPKYINTSDTAVFDKSHTLFAMNIARRSRRKGFICCEGYMDVISMHQAGFDNAVASLGTAFTFGHAGIIKRYADEVYLAYDSDGAGVEATKKVIAILREVGVGARVINMRPYKDPDEFIQNLGSEAFEERIKKAESGMMFLARIYSEEYDQSDPGELTKFQNQIARELAYIEDDLERNNYVDAIARKYVIDKDALAAKVHAYGVAGTAKPEIVERETRRLQEQQGYEEFPGRPETKDNKTAKLLLTWLVNRPELFARLDGVVSEADFEPGIYRTVADKLYSQYREKHKVEPAVVVNTFQDVEEQRLVAGMLQTDLAIDMTEEEVGNAITEVVKKIKLASIKKQLESENDMMKVQQLIKDRKKIEKFKVIL
ncbi:MAG: DNA primase [Coprococcus sp.]